MPIREHPLVGTILMCDFSSGFREPEMVKRRPVVVLSPKIAARPGLCTVVALSTTAPRSVQPFHCKITVDPRLPPPYDSAENWVKGDMIYSIGFHRLDFVRQDKGRDGKRRYRYQPLSDGDIKKIRECVLRGLGMSILTKHLV